MMHIRVLAIAALLAAPSHAAIIYQQTLGPGGGSVSFDDYLSPTPSTVWIGVSGGTIVSADWTVQADYTKYWWEVIGADEDGNEEYFLNGNNYFYLTGCAVSPGAPDCTSGFGFKSGLKNNTVRVGFKPPVSFNNCYPFTGQINIDCAFLYDPPFAALTIDVVGPQAITLTISDTRIAGAVPEPGSWMMLIAGSGLTGAALRRKARIRASG